MKFSVLLSIYHKESPEYFSLALNSIWTDQLLKPDEIVLVKDGKLTSEIEGVITKYSRILPLKIVPLEKNMGLSSALNIGLQHCTYDVVARMDTDDVCLPDRFLKQINYLSQHPETDIVGSYAIKISEKGIKGDLIKVPTENEIIQKYIWTCPFIHPTVVFRKEKIIAAGGYRKEAGPRQDDYDLWFRCAVKKLNFANIEEPLLYYRFFSDSIQKNNIKVGWARFKVGLRWCKRLGASWIAYIGITLPLIRSLLPHPFNIYFNRFMVQVNPRNR